MNDVLVIALQTPRRTTLNYFYILEQLYLERKTSGEKTGKAKTSPSNHSM